MSSGRWALSALLLVVTAEGAARLAGFAPWTPGLRAAAVDPPGWMGPHERWGWSTRPGRYSLKLGDGRFVTTHDEEGRVSAAGRGARIDVHGGSVAYGYGVGDDVAWPSQLARRTDLQVTNLAVPGWGMAQVALRVRERLSDPPAAVVVAYASFHDERTTLLGHWRRILATHEAGAALQGLQAPRVRLDHDTLSMELAPVGWSPGLAHRSAVAFLAERAWEESERRRVRPAEVSHRLMVQLAQEVEDAGTRFVVLTLDQQPGTRRAAERWAAAGVAVLDGGVDLDDPSWNLQPADPHGNAAAHDGWATSVQGWLSAQGVCCERD